MERIKHLLTLNTLTPALFDELLSLSGSLKQNENDPEALHGKNLALLFEKPSTRTRVSFEVGIDELQGNAVTLNANEIQLSRGEPVRDTARVLSRYADAIIARVYDHSSLETCAEFGSVPVINALSDFTHPCQGIADYFTIQEEKGSIENLNISYIGDGNNVCHSLIFGAALSGASLTVSTPDGYEPDRQVLDLARNQGKKTDADITFERDPEKAATGADVLYTDVWTSMGDEEESNQRKEAFQSYQIQQTLLDRATSDVMVMHCLPAHRGEEITDDVIEGPNSAVWTQAENRLHTQKALLQHMFDPGV